MNRTAVIIPNYNGIQYIEACIDSLRRACEASGPFDVIVVDNGSKDESLQYLKEQEETGFIRLIRLEENTGFAYAVNRGIEEADTEFVLLLNNDITIDEDLVKCLEESISSDERLFSVNALMRSMSDPSVVDGAGDYYCALGWAYAAYKGRDTASVRTAGDRHIFSACGGASIYRKSILDRTGLFDEEHFAYLEDVDLGYRARILGYRSLVCMKAGCDHAGSGFSGSRYNKFKIDLSAKNSIYIIYKNMPLLQIIINLPLLIAGFLIKTLFFAVKGYGKVYLRGLGKGFALCASKKGRERKVRFKFNNLPNYVLIQIELWINIIRRLLV